DSPGSAQSLRGRDEPQGGWFRVHRFAAGGPDPGDPSRRRNVDAWRLHRHPLGTRPVPSVRTSGTRAQEIAPGADPARARRELQAPRDRNRKSDPGEPTMRKDTRKRIQEAQERSLKQLLSADQAPFERTLSRL